MDDDTRAALLKSIEHWRENEAVTSADEASCSSDQCALCMEFNIGVDFSDCCERCPVCKKTGEILCGGSPYEDADEALEDWAVATGRASFMDGWRAREAFHLAARDERLFLESLLEDF